jgi:predicted SAM-dependent methyltransferase
VSRVPPEHRDRLTVVRGRFPHNLSFAPGSFDAIHASNLLHFLRPAELVAGLQLVARWLAAGGKLFVVAGTPYVGNLASFVPTYLERKRAGVEWPGEIENVHAYSSHFSVAELPSFVHLLDDEKLRRAIESAGLEVERIEMFARANLPDYLKYDGRENLGAVARKS